MTRKALLAVTLVLPFVALSGAAYAGPSAFYPPVCAASQASGPYAQYVPSMHDDGTQCRYQGGPKSPIWHQHVH